MLPQWYQMFNPGYYGLTDPVVCEAIRIFLHIFISYALARVLLRTVNLQAAFFVTLLVGFVKEFLDLEYIMIFSWADICCDTAGCLLAFTTAQIYRPQRASYYPRHYLSSRAERSFR